jgi:small-conductance mechanosensitive channel
MLSFRAALFIGILGTFPSIALTADSLPAASPKPQAHTRAVMTGEQVVRILDETVDWYRTLGLQQQAATQPSDLLIVYANRQTADRVIGLAFDIARANAELLSSEADLNRDTDDSAFSMQARADLRKQLDAQRARLQEQIPQLRRQAAASRGQRAELEAKASGLQSELDLINARRNLLDTMQQFVSQSDENGTGASALKAHIDAIAASIPSTAVVPPAPAATAAAVARVQGGLLNQIEEGTSGSLGIWDLGSNVLKLSAKSRMIETIDQKTAELQETFAQIRSPPLEQLKTLASRGDALAHQAENASNAGLRGVRDQFDTLSWLFKQTADILVPLSKEGVLLSQYRHNLSNWREAVKSQYRDALKALGTRVAFLLLLLAAVWVIAELWRRAVMRYVQEVRRRNQLLLIRKIVLWVLVIAIVGFSFATELGTLVTFVGLITAGLAVAMQSVLVSFVGYFFLIGKYGIRVGDRVQIGNVTGEVIELGLVRLHLMELGGQGLLGPTGRVVAFANSVVFQSSGGVFKQLPGVNLAWHEITLSLPAGADYSAMKERLLAAVNHVLGDYREDIERQTSRIQQTTSSGSGVGGDVQPQVQLKFGTSGVDAVVRYPVQLQRAAEIDERVSRELMRALSTEGGNPALPVQTA